MSQVDMELFGSHTPRVYRLSEIFKPVIDGTVTEEDEDQQGKIVPAVESLVVENLGEGSYRIYVVQDVDNEGDDPSYRCYLREVFNNVGLKHRMFNYGDDLLKVFYQNDGFTSVPGGTTYKGTWDAGSGSYPSDPENGDFWLVDGDGTVDGTDYEEDDWAVYKDDEWVKETNGVLYNRLIVDRNLLFISDQAVSYTLVNSKDEKVVVPQDDLTDPNNSDGLVPMIPELLDDGSTGNRQIFEDCALLYDPNPGDVLTLEVFDDEDKILSSYTVIAQPVADVGTKSDAEEVILRMEIYAPSMSWNDDNQIEISASDEPTHDEIKDDIQAQLILGDDTDEIQDIDDEVCFIYGLDDLPDPDNYSDHVDEVYEFILKYFLPTGLHSIMEESEGSERFLVKTGEFIITD